VERDQTSGVPRPRPSEPAEGSEPAEASKRPRAKDIPARPYNRAPGVKLLDPTGLLVVLGLSFAGFVLALIMTRHVL
jgi:hypothetical protein